MNTKQRTGASRAMDTPGHGAAAQGNPSVNSGLQPAVSPAKGDGFSSFASSSTATAGSAASTNVDHYRKRGRVESAGNEPRAPADGLAREVAVAMDETTRGAAGAMRDRFGSPHRGLTWLDSDRRRAPTQRSSSLPNIYPQQDDAAVLNIFPDLNPRDLRIAEVRSWYSPWMDRQFQCNETPFKPQDNHDHALINAAQNGNTKLDGVLVGHVAWTERQARDGSRTPPLMPTSKQSTYATDEDFDRVAQQLADEFSLEEKGARTASAPVLPTKTPPPSASKGSKRPILRLKLEDMPTPQQAEDRANRAATRIIARREAMEKAMNEAHAIGEVPQGVDAGKSATQQAIMRLNFKSYSSGDESDTASPTGRFSAGSAYSPNHGMFTTKMVAVSEAGISSPDSASLHLQENLERVKEIGRGASGVVYKSIHIPTLKVVAVKDVPVYGRGQRRQMVRELHALYSNLVPIANDEQPPMIQSGTRPRQPSSGRPRASPYIVSFYDAFVDRAKNCICLVMEYMSAGSLQDIVLRGGCQNEKVLSRLAAGVMQGLSHIHSKNMVHRDIKPHNLLTNRRGEVKISDFGLAKTLNDNAGMTKTFVGTLLYMAPERIGGGDYSYPADIWSFGLALVSVALGKYPLPTQDGFFGLVDTVANEQYLNLPEDKFSPDCREFIKLCLTTDPSERPTADALLQHLFVTKYSKEETLEEWLSFIDATQLCEDRGAELESLGEAVYRHLYERNVKFSCQPQSDYGTSFAARSSQSSHRRDISIHPVQMSLQLGLANYLGLPVHQVHTLFETKRGFYNDKLLEDYCFSPQSWTASPGIARRQQLFGDSESPQTAVDRAGSSSIWKKLQNGLTKLKIKKKKSKESRDEKEDRWSLRAGAR